VSTSSRSRGIYEHRQWSGPQVAKFRKKFLDIVSNLYPDVTRSLFNACQEALKKVAPPSNPDEMLDRMVEIPDAISPIIKQWQETHRLTDEWVYDAVVETLRFGYDDYGWHVPVEIRGVFTYRENITLTLDWRDGESRDMVRTRLIEAFKKAYLDPFLDRAQDSLHTKASRYDAELTPLPKKLDQNLTLLARFIVGRSRIADIANTLVDDSSIELDESTIRRDIRAAAKLLRLKIEREL